MLQRCHFILLIAVLWPGQPAMCWNKDPAVNDPICPLIGTQSGVQIVSDGSGGIIAAWSDSRDDAGDIYAQRLNSNGKTLWLSKGVPVCTADQIQSNTSLVSDGAGGAIIAWEDNRTNGPGTYLQRLGPTGELLWPQDSTSIARAKAPKLCADGLGGAIIVTRRLDFGMFCFVQLWLHAQRIDSTGQKLWGGGRALDFRDEGDCTPPQASYDILPDGNGGAYVAWSASSVLFSNPDSCNIQHLYANGDLHWEAVLGEEHGDRREPRIVHDNAGGIIASWYEAPGDIYAQRFNDSGSPQWETSGVLVCANVILHNSSWGPTLPGAQLVSDAFGGAYIVWHDSQEDSGLYAQRVDVLGTVQWPQGGVQVSSHGIQTFSVARASSGTALIVWSDYRAGHNNVFAQHLNQEAQNLLPFRGQAICTAHADQDDPVMIVSPDDLVIVAWEDMRSGNTSQVFGSRVLLDGEPDIGLQPDITATWTDAKLRCKPQKWFCRASARMQLQNIGDGNTTAVETVIYWSEDNVFHASDSLVKRLTVKGLRAGSSKHKKVSFPFMVNKTGYLIAVTDAPGEIEEQFENNNLAVIPLTMD